MPQFYKLGNPGITSLSIDGIEHKVNADGFLRVDMLTQNLKREIAAHQGELVDPENKEQMASIKAQMKAEEDERNDLFSKLDQVNARKTDRRRSLQQLRVMWQDYLERQARVGGVNSALAAALQGRPAAG